MTDPTLVSIYRYPVKGLTPQALQATELAVGQTIAFDRAYAIENGPGRFDPSQPRHLPKISFLMLMRDERLATLDARFDDATRTLTILRAGKQVARGALDTAIGRTMIEQFVAAYMKPSLRGAPKIVAAADHSFSDVAAKCLHIVNLASIRALERVVGRPIDPLRFRANLYIDGVAPFAELAWTDQVISIGTAKLKVFKRTVRCDAINVDPASGERDMALPSALQRTYGHTDFGIYATVTASGPITAGAGITI